MVFPSAQAAFERCSTDGEFQLATRHWTGGYRLHIDEHVIGVSIVDGQAAFGVPDPGPGVIEIGGPAEIWEPMFQTVPPRLSNTISVMVGHGLTLDCDPLLWWQYLPATERFIELLRVPGMAASTTVEETGPAFRRSAPTGGYVHVPIDGHDYRIYFEEAGQGIPVLLQHTAGAHSVQWRHLFESPAITERFRLIAYDLPYHGKSLPPVSRPWWENEYRLTGEFLRQVPLGLTEALELDNPVFMGCSVGGLLALDLALHHGDLFRAVVAIEGALHIGGDIEAQLGFNHPQVSNASKARMMEGLCSPTSPIPYVKEISHVYSAAWPPAFIGDLWYYMVDYDIREQASEIDTEQVQVHIMNGEYDYTGSITKGREAHKAIPGSTHRAMSDIGHFPMVENPDRFMHFLMPVLEAIAS